ncbi:MAG: metallophosphoesterase [Candidatus Geothermincolia bacterium]
MRVAFTGDLHIDISQKNWNIVPVLAEFIKIVDPDVFILCGDISPHLDQVRFALEYFQGLACPKIFVPGNHDVWVSEEELKMTGSDSFEKYYYLLPRLAHEAGFIPIWMEPFVLNGIGFTGSIGWYDYSFGSGLFQFTEEEYEAKNLKDSVWNDRRYARWMDVVSIFDEDIRHLPDVEVARQFNQRLAADITMLAEDDSVREIIAVTHHPPFREMVTFKGEQVWDYFTAFMGSQETGRLLQAEPKVTHAICGHLHRRQDLCIGNVRALSSSVGYLYQDRRKPIQVAEESLGLVYLLGDELFDRDACC